MTLGPDLGPDPGLDPGCNLGLNSGPDPDPDPDLGLVPDPVSDLVLVLVSVPDPVMDLYMIFFRILLTFGVYNFRAGSPTTTPLCFWMMNSMSSTVYLSKSPSQTDRCVKQYFIGVNTTLCILLVKICRIGYFGH